MSRFGEQPLPQTAAAAAQIRSLVDRLVSLEQPHALVEDIAATITRWNDELAALVPPDPTPRLGTDGTPDQRVYLDHSRDIGAYNPVFPEYDVDAYDDTSASGTISFPVVYEGPPGLVHGGFLAVFFDSVIQQHNCLVGAAGRTRSLSVRYRRPTPLLTELTFDITRVRGERNLNSVANLRHDGEVLCSAEVDAVCRPVAELTPGAYSGRGDR